MLDCLGSYALWPWLSGEDWEHVSHAKSENFTYIEYQDWSFPTNNSGYPKLYGCYNKVTKEVMWLDPGAIIAYKCALMTGIGYHGLTCTIRVGYHIVMGMAEGVSTLIKGGSQALTNITKGEIGRAIIQDIWEEAIGNSLAKVCNRLWEVARTIYYTIGLEIGCLVGVWFNGLKARAILGQIEFNLNHRVPSHGTKYIPGNYVYTMICMQPWCRNINETMVTNGIVHPRVHILREAAVLQDLAPDNKLQAWDWFLLPLLPCFC